VDVAKTKAAEGELDNFTCRRHEKRVEEGARPAEQIANSGFKRGRAARNRVPQEQERTPDTVPPVRGRLRLYSTDGPSRTTTCAKFGRP
jgi:hypothetical protein